TSATSRSTRVDTRIPAGPPRRSRRPSTTTRRASANRSSTRPSRRPPSPSAGAASEKPTRDAPGPPPPLAVSRVEGPASSTVKGVTPPTLPALATRMSDLAARAQPLSDEIEITNLQHASGFYVDRKMWDDVSELFVDDGTMEVGLQGVYAGRTSIRRGLTAFGPAGVRPRGR